MIPSHVYILRSSQCKLGRNLVKFLTLATLSTNYVFIKEPLKVKVQKISPTILDVNKGCSVNYAYTNEG